MKLRHSDEAGTFDVDPDEIHGYVDAIILYIMACYSKANNRSPIGMSDVMDWFLANEGIRGWQQLSLEVREKTHLSVLMDGLWEVQELKESDFDNGKNFMEKFVKKVASENASASYQRGVRTARDSLLLYVDFVDACERRKFRFLR